MSSNLGACNVNFCVNDSVKDCEFCVGVSFCAIHEDHSKFHYRRCQILGCFNVIGQKNNNPIDDVRFHSKFPPCLVAFCLHSKFIFCKRHSNHESHDVTAVPNCGYSFECSEIRSAQDRLVYLCDSNCNEFDFVGMSSNGGFPSEGDGVDTGFDDSFNLEDVDDLIPSARKRRKCKIPQSNGIDNLNQGSGVVDVENPLSNERFRHVCPHCRRTVRAYHSDSNLALRRHWAWHCKISGTEEVDTELQFEEGVFVFPGSQLPPQRFLHSSYYKLSMYRKSGVDRLEEGETVSIFFVLLCFMLFPFVDIFIQFL